MSLDLSQIRRICIVICLILLLGLGGSLYAVSKNRSAVNDQRYTVTAFTVDANSIAALKKKYPSGEFGGSIKTEQTKSKIQVPDGFCLVMELSDARMAKSLRDSLIQHKNIKAKGIEIIGTSLRIKKKYKNEADANKAIQEIKKTASVTFVAKTNTKEVAKQGYKCVVTDVTALDIEDMEAFMRKNKFIDINSDSQEEASEEISFD